MPRSLALCAALLALSGCVAGGAGTGQVQAGVSVCFLPGENCFDRVAGEIDTAETSVLVEEYSLTNRRVIAALVAAKARGVGVQAVLDRATLRQKADGGAGRTGPEILAAAGIPVWIDDTVAIAHGKVLVIDERIVVGGSANLSRGAESRNAENVLTVDSPEIAARFTANWNARRAVSGRFTLPSLAGSSGAGAE